MIKYLTSLLKKPKWVKVLDRDPDEEGFYVCIIQGEKIPELSIRFFDFEDAEHVKDVLYWLEGGEVQLKTFPDEIWEKIKAAKEAK